MALSTQERRGWLLLGVISAFVAIVLGAYAWKSLSRPIIGPDNCIYEDKKLLRRTVTDQTVIVVDQSETLSDSHKRQVRAKLVEYLADDKLLPVNSRVILYTFGKNDFERSGAGQRLTPAPALCKPPSTGNVVIENEKKIAKTFYDRFVVPMYAAIEQSMGIALGERSPILEMIQYVSRSQDISEVPGSHHTKHLIIVSDLLQHSESVSHYKPWTYDKVMASNKALLDVDLRGWTVWLLYLQRYGRDQTLQSKEHFAFWERYFHEAGARIVRADRIP